MKLVTSALAIASATSLTAQTKPQPNIVLMLIDDQGWSDFSGMTRSDRNGLGVYKSTDKSAQDIKFYTPNLSKLSKEAVIFSQAYAEPVCAPTRANIMTGLFPTRHHMYTVTNPGDGQKQLGRRKNERHLASKFVTIAEVLTKNGYTCAHLGKWHLGNGKGAESPTGQGFAYNRGGGSQGQPPGGKVNILGPLYQDRSGKDVDPERGKWSGGTYWANFEGCFEKLTGLPGNGKPGQYLTDRLTEDSIQIMNEINNATKKKPFFVYLSHYGVHAPNAAKIEDMMAIENEYKRQNPDYVKTLNKNSTVKDVSKKLLFAGMVKAIDRSVGDVLKYLETTDDTRNPGYKLVDNTMFIYMSDNGGTVKKNYPPLRGKKCLAYEGGVRVPLMIKWKHKTAVRNEMVNATDFFPTFANMAGIKLPKDVTLDGVNILPLIEQTGTIKKRGLFRHQPVHDRPMSSSVIYDNYKLIYYYETPNSKTYLGYGKYELYNLEKDVGETINLAREVDLGKGGAVKQISDPVIRGKFALLQKMLNDWLIDTKAELPYVRDKNGRMTKKTVKLPNS